MTTIPNISPIEYIESEQGQILRNIENFNSFCNGPYVLTRLRDTIASLSNLRSSEDQTKDFLIEVLDETNNSCREVFENWLFKATEYDRSFYYAFKYLAQKTSRDLHIQIPIKHIDKDLLILLIQKKISLEQLDEIEEQRGAKSKQNTQSNGEYSNEPDLPELPVKLIIFDSLETINLVHDELKRYFPSKESELMKALNGERLAEKILFPHRGNMLIEVFRRLIYNGRLINNLTEVRNWICLNFTYRYKKGDIEKVASFKESTVYDVLKGKPGTEPSKHKRLLSNLEWLPHKSKNQLDTETHQEKLK